MPNCEPSPSGELSAGPGRAPRISVVVPAYNAGLQLSRCLDALCCSEYADFEVIVVDDCSTDNTHQIVGRFGGRYLRTPCRMGPAGARNLGVGHAVGEIVVFVDADVVLPPGALKLIAAEFDVDPELAAMFGSYDDAPPWRNFLSQYKNLMHHYIHQSANERAVTFWAGCGVMRKDVFQEFGGFNAEEYGYPSIEDIELGLRLALAGRRIRLNKSLQVKHLKKWTLRGLLRADILHRAVPWTRLILKTRRLPRDLNLTYSARVSAMLTGLLVLLLLLLPLRAAEWVRWPSTSVLLVGLGAAGLLLLRLNWPVYRFFAQKRGWGMVLGSVVFHWLYYLYSGIVFLLCSLGYSLRGSARRASLLAAQR